MTRFARAKGSKASNERREEEATPWHVMRQQLADQRNNCGARSDSDRSYNLKEILSNGVNCQQREEVWNDFGETTQPGNNHLHSNKEKYNNKNHEIKQNNTINSVKSVKALTKNANELLNYSKILQQDGKNETDVSESKSESKVTNQAEIGVSKNNLSPVVKSLKFSSHCGLNRNIEKDVEYMAPLKSKKRKLVPDSRESVSRSAEISRKKKKHNLPGKNIFIETPVKSKDTCIETQNSSGNTEFSLVNSESSVELGNQLNIKKKKKGHKKSIVESKDNLHVFPKQNENPKRSFSNEKKSTEKENSRSQQLTTVSNNANNNNKHYDFSESYDNQKNSYRKSFYNHPYEKGFQTIIANGREIHVVQYQGFFVKKDDAIELKKLRKKLLAQNIPKEKLENIMKLERRKAEKALAREKKKVCYHCRQFGHNFSDCPDIKEGDVVRTGMCFKCGSLEHSHFECKVYQHQEFRHAICFVCKEQGHIARQCPLNSQGLFPKGGSCHLCGEVTHLRKDCPKGVEEKTSKSVTLDTLNVGTVEDIGSKSLVQKETESKKKKVIKFK